MASYIHYIVVLVLISLTSIGDHTWACESWCSKRCMAQCYNFKGLNCWSFAMGGCCLTDCQRGDCMFQCPPPPASDSSGCRRRKRSAWGLSDDFQRYVTPNHLSLYFLNLIGILYHLQLATITRTHPPFSNVLIFIVLWSLFLQV